MAGRSAAGVPGFLGDEGGFVRRDELGDDSDQRVEAEVVVLDQKVPVGRLAAVAMGRIYERGGRKY